MSRAVDGHDHPRWWDADAMPLACREVTVGACRVHVVDEGRGPTLLMLHGNPGWSYAYRGVVERLAPSFRCVAVDYPGFGASTAPPGWGSRARDHAEVVAGVVDELGLEAYTLVAHDWGGPIGLAAAARRPERLAAVAFANTWAWPVADDPHFARFSALMGGPVGRFGARRLNLVVRAMTPAGHRARRLSAHERALWAAPSDTTERRAATSRFAREITAASDLLAEVEATLPALAGLPALLAWADRDIAFRERELDRWRAELPHARVVRLPGAGHHVPSDAPGPLAEAVEEWHRAAVAPAHG